MRTLRLSLVLCLAFSLSAPAITGWLPRSQAGDEAPWQEGYIILNDGTKLEGEIQILEGAGKVRRRKKGQTVSQEYDFTQIKDDKDNKKEIHATGGGGSGSQATGKKKMVAIKKTDGNDVRGEGEELANGDWKVKATVNGKVQEVTVKKGDIKEITEVEDDTNYDPDRFVDADCRFLLERPGKEWKIRKSTSPSVRAQAYFNEKDGAGFLTVGVKPYPKLADSAFADMTKPDVKKLQTEVEAETKGQFEKGSPVEVVAAELFGCPVYECRYEGNYPQETTVYKFIELRFVREGYLYTITGSCEKANFKPTIEQKLRDAFTSFSFLAPVGGDDDTYADTTKGFTLDRPTPKWTIVGRFFSEDAPVVMKNEDGLGAIRVTIEKGSKPSDVLDRLVKEAEDKKKSVENKTSSDSTRPGGIPVLNYHYEAFGADNTKHSFTGIVAQVGPRLIHVVGEGPLTDVRSQDIANEIQNALDHVRLVDPSKAAERVAKGAEASKAMSEALEAYKGKKLDDAVKALKSATDAFASYARAWFLLGIVYEDQNKWTECAEALTHAAELDPRKDYIDRQGDVVWKRGLDEWHAKPAAKWEDANKHLASVLRADPKNIQPAKRDEYKKFLTDWWGDLKKTGAKDMYKNVKFLVEKAFHETEINKALADILVDAGEAILGANKKDHDKAHTLANEALDLDKGNAKAEALKKKCQDAAKTAATPTPKK